MTALGSLALGFSSGSLALGYGWWGRLDGFLRLSSMEAPTAAVLIAAIHIISLASLGGAALSLSNRGIGRSVLLTCAVAWLVLAAIVGGGLTAPLIVTALLAAIGGFTGFIAGGPQVRWLSRDWAAEVDQPDDEDTAFPIPPISASTRLTDGVRLERDGEIPPFGAIPPEESGLGRDRLRSRTDVRVDGRSSGQRKRRQKGSSELGIGVAATVFLLGTAIILGYFVWAGDDTTAMIAPEVASTSSASALQTLEDAETAARIGPGVAPGSPESKVEARRKDVVSQFASLPPPSQPEADSLEAVTRPIEPLVPEASTQAQVTAASPDSLTASNGKFATPAGYCAAEGDVDDPDLTRIAGGVPELIASVLEAGMSSQAEVRWRCMDAAVWICVQPSGNRACDKVPSAIDRVLICASHPDAVAIQTAGGTWRCDGFTPVVSDAQLAPPDRRGFDRTAWRRLS